MVHDARLDARLTQAELALREHVVGRGGPPRVGPVSPRPADARPSAPRLRTTPRAVEHLPGTRRAPSAGGTGGPDTAGPGRSDQGGHPLGGACGRGAALGTGAPPARVMRQPAELRVEHIVEVLNKHEVRYVVIGGFAAVLQRVAPHDGRPRHLPGPRRNRRPDLPVRGSRLRRPRDPAALPTSPSPTSVTSSRPRRPRVVRRTALPCRSCATSSRSGTSTTEVRGLLSS